GRGTSSGGEQAWASQLLTVPFGQFLLGAIGIGVIVAGLSQLKEAKDERFKRVLKLHQMSRKERTWVTRLAKIGLCARGVVFPLIGYGILRAAMANSAARAQGFGGALREIASKPFGQVLLIAVAAGLVAYGIYMLAVAKYRRLATGPQPLQSNRESRESCERPGYSPLILQDSGLATSASPSFVHCAPGFQRSLGFSRPMNFTSQSATKRASFLDATPRNGSRCSR